MNQYPRRKEILKKPQATPAGGNPMAPIDRDHDTPPPPPMMPPPPMPSDLPDYAEYLPPSRRSAAVSNPGQNNNDDNSLPPPPPPMPPSPPAGSFVDDDDDEDENLPPPPPATDTARDNAGATESDLEETEYDSAGTLSDTNSSDATPSDARAIALRSSKHLRGTPSAQLQDRIAKFSQEDQEVPQIRSSGRKVVMNNHGPYLFGPHSQSNQRPAGLNNGAATVRRHSPYRTP